MTTTENLVESALAALGVEVVRVGEREITAYCPVHMLTVGRRQSHPKWYMNVETTAALCFTCGWRGNLARLASDLEADLDLDEIQMDQALRGASELVSRSDEDEEEDEPDVYVSEYGFNKHPYPPEGALLGRKLTRREAVRTNLRWDAEHHYWLIPVYRFDGTLLGWQEKAPHHFLNVPRHIRMRRSLFALQACTMGQQVFVVESPLDACRFLRYGHNAVASYGAAVSDDQLAVIVKQFNHVVLAFDNDNAGLDATARVAERITKRWGRSTRVSYYAYPLGTEGEDPGSLPSLMFRSLARRPSSVHPSYLAAL